VLFKFGKFFPDAVKFRFPVVKFHFCNLHCCNRHCCNDGCKYLGSYTNAAGDKCQEADKRISRVKSVLLAYSENSHQGTPVQDIKVHQEVHYKINLGVLVRSIVVVKQIPLLHEQVPFLQEEVPVRACHNYTAAYDGRIVAAWLLLGLPKWPG
jgi:hypothetical protein